MKHIFFLSPLYFCLFKLGHYDNQHIAPPLKEMSTEEVAHLLLVEAMDDARPSLFAHSKQCVLLPSGMKGNVLGRETLVIKLKFGTFNIMNEVRRAFLMLRLRLAP